MVKESVIDIYISPLLIKSFSVASNYGYQLIDRLLIIEHRYFLLGLVVKNYVGIILSRDAWLLCMRALITDDMVKNSEFVL